MASSATPSTAYGSNSSSPAAAAVLKWHPDKYEGDALEEATAMFNKIKLANSVLSDANKRGQLDAGISTAEDLAFDEKQDQWNKDYEYYSTSCPNGYTRRSDVGQRTWNPTEKVSKTFDLNPCRISPHVLARDNAAAANPHKVIYLRGERTKALTEAPSKPLSLPNPPEADQAPSPPAAT